MKVASPEPFIAGDMLFFKGRDELSRAIAWKTSTWRQWAFGQTFSHVEILCDSWFESPNPVVTVGSTMLCDLPCLVAGRKVRGVQVHDPQQRIDAYDGEVYRFRLTDALDELEAVKLMAFLRSEVGKPYDYRRALLLAGRYADARHLVPTPDDRFCSELAAEALKRVDRIVDRSSDPESFSPNSLSLTALHSGGVWPLGDKQQSRRLK